MGRAVAVIIAIVAVVFLSGEVRADLFQLPGVVLPSGCRDGAVLSTEQFTTTGFSNVRTANPNDEIVSGAWVIANNFTPDINITLPPNCAALSAASADYDKVYGAQVLSPWDQLGLNLIAVRIKPTINSAAEADIREIKLVWDVNANGLYEPLLDLVMQTKPGNLLDTQDGVIFFNGPQNPLAFLSNVFFECFVGALDIGPDFGLGPIRGTNSRLIGINGTTANGCFIALLAVVVIGDSPQTGSQFGLELEAMAADIPGTNGISSFTFSSGFSSSRNPQASNVRLHMVGGLPSSHTPIEHISNGSGSPESAVRPLTFTGGQQGEGLLSRFRALKLVPGTREAVAMAVAICDGAELANRIASVLPPIAAAPPTIAGGLAALPCIPSAGTDGFSTGINGATLIFRGPLARFMSTVRLYADECSPAGVAVGAAGCVTNLGVAAPTTSTQAGGGDGFLMQAGELSEQVIPVFNEETGEALAQFGFRQEQVLFTGNGNPIAAGSDPVCRAAAPCTGIAIPAAGSRPLILIFTVDIDQNAPGGVVDVLLGLQSFDDTAININVGVGSNPCSVFGPSNAPGGNAFKIIGAGTCASNFLNIGPEIYSFTVEGPEHPSTPNTLAAFDTNQSCFIDDPEFFAMIDGWAGNSIGDGLFFDGVDAWTGQDNICAALGSARGFKLGQVDVLSNQLGVTTFSVSGQSIESMAVSIYGLDGTLMFHNQVGGTHLSWNQTTASGAPLANGTYLYVVSAQDGFGNIASTSVKKLVVIR